jgi:hypothetical protein
VLHSVLSELIVVTATAAQLASARYEADATATHPLLAGTVLHAVSGPCLVLLCTATYTLCYQHPVTVFCVTVAFVTASQWLQRYWISYNCLGPLYNASSLRNECQFVGYVLMKLVRNCCFCNCPTAPSGPVWLPTTATTAAAATAAAAFQPFSEPYQRRH